MWRTFGLSCIIKTRAKADVAPRAALSAGACSAIARMTVSSSQGPSYIRAGPIGSPSWSTASIVPEVPSTASARTLLRSHDEPSSEMTARTQFHHVAGAVASPKVVIATAAEPTVAPPPASAAARTPRRADINSDHARAHQTVPLSSDRLAIGFSFPVHELLLLGGRQHADRRLFRNAGCNVRISAPTTTPATPRRRRATPQRQQRLCRALSGRQAAGLCHQQPEIKIARWK